MKRNLLPLSTALFIIVSTAVSQTIPKLEFEKYELANGLDVILRIDKRIPAVGVVLWYHVGAKNERPGRTGFAHLFEHMMFQGSKHVKGEYLKLVTEAGGRANGSTTEDRTNYFETVPKEALEYALWLESDRMGYLLDAVTKENLENQRSVVKNEKRQGDNSPYSAVQYLIADHFYPKGHPYDHTVIGSMEDLSAASLDDIKDFFKTWYTPNNCTLALVGDFDPAEAKRLVRKYFGPIPAGPPLSRPRVNIPDLSSTRILTATDNVPNARLYLVYPSAEMYSPDEAPLDLAAALLGAGKSSILHRRLVRDLQLASDVSVRNSASEISGEFHIVVTAKPGASLKEIREVVDRELAAFAKSGPDTKQLSAEKARMESRFLSSLERLGGFGGVGDRLCRYNTFLGDPDYFQKDYQRFGNASATDVKHAFGRWIDGAHRLEIEVHPETAKRPDAKDFDRGSAPAISEVQPIPAPRIEKRILPNGLEVIVAERRGLPVVSAVLQIRECNLLEGPDKAGESALTAEMLDEGAGKRSALEISEDISALGASLSLAGGRRGASASVMSPKKNLDAVFSILSDVVMRPTFPAAEFERERKLAVDGLKRSKSNPDATASRVFNALIFGAEHPLGMPGIGSEASLRGLTIDDLRRNHGAYWKPNNASLIFAGDIDIEEAVRLADKHLGDWVKGDVAEGKMPAAAPPSEHVVFLVDRPAAPQSQLRIGSLAPPRSTPDYFALQVMNMLLGGSFSSRINLNLREDKGYTYGARTSMENSREYGVWTASTGVQTKVTKAALLELRKEIEGISGSRPITEEEIEGIRNTMTRSYSQNFESNSALLGRLASLVALGLSFDELSEFVPAVKAQTPATALAAAKAHIDFSKCITVVVGDRALIEEDLKSLGWGRVVLVNEDGIPVVK